MLANQFDAQETGEELFEQQHWPVIEACPILRLEQILIAEHEQEKLVRSGDMAWR